jgi:hypothetical protein
MRRKFLSVGNEARIDPVEVVQAATQEELTCILTFMVSYKDKLIDYLTNVSLKEAIPTVRVVETIL